MYFHLNYLAYRAQQEWLLIRFAVERKPTHDQAASEQTRVKMAGVCGSDYKILLHVGKNPKGWHITRRHSYRICMAGIGWVLFCGQSGFFEPLGVCLCPSFWDLPFSIILFSK